MTYLLSCIICNRKIDVPQSGVTYIQTDSELSNLLVDRETIVCPECGKSQYAELLRGHWDSLCVAEKELYKRFNGAANHMIEEWRKECL